MVKTRDSHSPHSPSSSTSDAWQCGHRTSVATASPVQQDEHTRSNSSSRGFTSRSQATSPTSTSRPTQMRFVFSSYTLSAAWQCGQKLARSPCWASVSSSWSMPVITAS